MKNLLLIVMMSIYIFAGTMNQKMIISASKNSFEAEQILRTAKLLVDERKQFPQLDMKIEKLDEYFLVTMSPIDSIVLRHTLYSALETKFSGIFTIDNIVFQNDRKVTVKHTPMKQKIASKISKVIVGTKVVDHKNIKDLKEVKSTFFQNIDNEWYALVALVIAGLMLIIRSSYQIGKIKKLQRQLEEIQEKSDKQL
jgi:hypothetical protein